MAKLIVDIPQGEYKIATSIDDKKLFIFPDFIKVMRFWMIPQTAM